MKFLLFLFSITAFAQQDIVPKVIDSILIDANFFYGSNGFAYYSKNNVLFQHDGTNTKSFSDVQLGKIASVDITNPLQIIVFYKDFNTLVFLDNQMNETTRISGNNSKNNLLFDKIGLAQKNNFWFYEPTVQKIGLYNFATDSYKFISTFLDKPLLFTASFYNNYYWITTDFHLFEINVYGNIKSLGVVPEFDNLQIINNSVILYSKDNLLNHYDLKTQKASRILISEKTILNFEYQDEILSIFTNYKIVKSQIKLP